MTRVQFEVFGTPAPKGSARAMLNKKTGKAFTFAGGSKATELKLGAWHQDVCVAALREIGERAEPVFIARPLMVEFEFRLARPRGHWSKKAGGGLLASAPIAPATTPDIDKLARSTLDSLTGLVFDDDSRIVCLIARKVYAAPGREGARIDVHEWTGG